MRRPKDERGAAVVETALVVSLLIMLALGAVEYGLAFREWLGLAASAREGARVGASAGPTTDGDCLILESVAAALFSTTGAEVLRVDVSDFNAATQTTGSTNSYRPFDPATDDPTNLKCGTWFRSAYAWPEGTRDNSGEDRDWLATRVVYRHTWTTDFLWWTGTVDWQSRSVMRLEPVNYG